MVAPKAQGQLYFTSCSGDDRQLRRELGHRDHLHPPQHHATFVIARRATDDYGNSLLDAPVTVTLMPSSGSVSLTTLTLGAGVTSSATVTFTPPAGTTRRTIDAHGTTTGVAVAKATLTVRPY